MSIFVEMPQIFNEVVVGLFGMVRSFCFWLGMARVCYDTLGSVGQTVFDKIGLDYTFQIDQIAIGQELGRFRFDRSARLNKVTIGDFQVRLDCWVKMSYVGRQATAKESQVGFNFRPGNSEDNFDTGISKGLSF